MIKKLYLFFLFLNGICISFGSTKVDSIFASTQSNKKSKKTNKEIYDALLNIYINSNDISDSIADLYIKESRNIAKKLSNTYFEAQTYKYEGDWYFNKKKFYRALDNYQIGYELLLQNNLQDSTAEILLEIGNTFYEHGLLNQSLNYFERAFEVLKKQNNIFLLNKYYNYKANIYISLKKFDLASYYFDKAYNEIKTTSNYFLIAQSFNKIASVFLHKNQLIEALSYLNEAQNVLLSQNSFSSQDNKLLTSIYLQTGEVFQVKKLYIDALKNYNLALQNSQSPYDIKEQYALSLYHISNLLFEENKLDESFIYSNKSLVIANYIQDLGLKKNIYILISNIYTKKNKPFEAIALIKKASEITDSISNNQLSSKFAEIKAVLDLSDKENKIKVQEKTIKAQNTIRQFLYVIVLIVSIVIIIFVILWLRQRRLNEELAVKNHKINAQQVELKLLNGTKDKFFSILAHNLRNPFNALINLSEAQIKELENKNLKDIENYSKIINDSAKKGFTLLENLLLWSQSQTKSIEPYFKTIDLTKIIQIQIKHFNQVLKLKKIDVEISSDGSHITADENLLIIVIRNILLNAIHFSPENKIITITIKRDQNFVNTSIQDQGIGIKKEDLHKLFDLGISNNSISAKGINKGTGLGLIVSKDFIELNKGNISIESEENKGTTVSIKLPYHSNEGALGYTQFASENNFKLDLSDSIKEEISEWLEELSQFEIYEISELRNMLEKLPIKDKTIEAWKKAMQDAVYLSDGIQFKKLITLAKK